MGATTDRKAVNVPGRLRADASADFLHCENRGGGAARKIRTPFFPMKPKPLTEAQFLAFLEKASERRAAGPEAARRRAGGRVQGNPPAQQRGVVHEVRGETGSVPDATPETVAKELQEQIAATFGADATVSGDAGRGGQGRRHRDRAARPDDLQRDQGERPDAGEGGRRAAESAVRAVPGDAADGRTELVWVLARREDLGPDEAGRALAHIEELFWASKAGQQFQRKGGEKTFAEFIANVPSAALLESGLKRHYKEPEQIHSLQLLSSAPQPENKAEKFAVEDVNF